jgi:hypothetical protein
MQTSSLSTLLTALTALATIASATVVVSLGHIDAGTYAAIVAGVAGIGTGAGVHAIGVRQGSNGGSS